MYWTKVKYITEEQEQKPEMKRAGLSSIDRFAFHHLNVDSLLKYKIRIFYAQNVSLPLLLFSLVYIILIDTYIRNTRGPRKSEYLCRSAYVVFYFVPNQKLIVCNEWDGQNSWLPLDVTFFYFSFIFYFAFDFRLIFHQCYVSFLCST